jgi:hypothetical protein
MSQAPWPACVDSIPKGTYYDVQTSTFASISNCDETFPDTANTFIKAYVLKVLYSFAAT